MAFWNRPTVADVEAEMTAYEQQIDHIEATVLAHVRQTAAEAASVDAEAAATLLCAYEAADSGDRKLQAIDGLLRLCKVAWND